MKQIFSWQNYFREALSVMRYQCDQLEIETLWLYAKTNLEAARDTTKGLSRSFRLLVALSYRCFSHAARCWKRGDEDQARAWRKKAEAYHNRARGIVYAVC